MVVHKHSISTKYIAKIERNGIAMEVEVNTQTIDREKGIIRERNLGQVRIGVRENAH